MRHKFIPLFSSLKKLEKLRGRCSYHLVFFLVHLNLLCMVIIIFLLQDGSISSYAKTPLHSGSQTPLYKDTGNKTPMHDSEFIFHLYKADTECKHDKCVYFTGGSRTPLHYGSMTPLHDGSRTPNASSEWDPTVSNTYPSPAYNPSMYWHCSM